MVVTDTVPGTQYLILWISPDKNYGYWHNLSDSSRTPTKFICKDVSAEVVDGKYETELFAIQLRPEGTLSIIEREYRDRRWDLKKKIIEREPEIYEKNSRLRLLSEVSNAKNTTISNLYKLLDCYWRSGKNKNGLLPLYSNCGAKSKPEKEDKIPANRKVLTNSDYSNFDRAIHKYYLTREKRSLTSTYEKLLQDFYTIKSDNGRLKLLSSSEIPTFRQFQYWYSKNSNIIKTSKKRDGEREFELNNRAVLGKSDYGLMGPGAQFQVDATIGDVYLLSQFDHYSIIGRPVLYFIMDAFSRMVVGIGVGLEG
jgi:hypothetical protein